MGCGLISPYLRLSWSPCSPDQKARSASWFSARAVERTSRRPSVPAQPGRCQVSALWCAQTLPAIRGVPGPTVPLDDPAADSHGRWAGGVMTPRFKGKPNFDLSQPCPLCAYKIQANELVRLASHLIKCPKCGGAFNEMGNRKPLSTS
jgi:hypothetical protein